MRPRPVSHVLRLELVQDASILRQLVDGRLLPLELLQLGSREADQVQPCRISPPLLPRFEQSCGDLPGHALHMVRDVAPNKRMWCLSFVLPRGVGVAGGEEGGGAAKRARTGA